MWHYNKPHRGAAVEIKQREELFSSLSGLNVHI